MITRSLIFVAALALSSCALDPQGGYRPMQRAGGSADSVTFNEANGQCWSLAYGLLGGNAMDSTRSRTYEACMRDRGWEDPRMRPQPTAVTAPGSR